MVVLLETVVVLLETVVVLLETVVVLLENVVVLLETVVVNPLISVDDCSVIVASECLEDGIKRVLVEV